MSDDNKATRYKAKATASGVRPRTNNPAPHRQFHLLQQTCPSVTLVHPANAVGWKETPFGRDTRVTQSSIVLERVPVPHEKGEIWGSEPPTAAISQLPRAVNIFTSIR